MPGNGPARKPTDLKRYEGWPGHDSYKTVNEPLYPNALPNKPAKMSAAASRHWDKLVREMSVSGVLKRVDGDALRQYCEDEVTLEKAYEAMWKIPDLFTSEEGAKARRGILELGKSLIIQRREFGLTPSARTRIVVEARERPQDFIDDAVFNKPADLLVLPKSGTGR